MKEAGGGKIINIASMAGLLPSENIGVYSVSKAGAIMLTKVLAKELGASNINMNAFILG